MSTIAERMAAAAGRVTGTPPDTPTRADTHSGPRLSGRTPPGG